MTASPNAVSESATGRTLKFNYVAAPGGTSEGTVTLTVPGGGWSPPSMTPTDPGYSTSNLGSLSVSGQIITVSGLNLLGGQQLQIFYGDKTGGGTGVTVPSATGPTMWTASEKSTSGGSLLSISSSPVLVTIYAADGSGTLHTPAESTGVAAASHTTIAFTYKAAPGGMSNGAVKVVAPSGWSAPSKSGTAAGYVTDSLGDPISVSGQSLTVSGVSLTGGQTFTITYGSKSLGGPGALVTTATGVQLWSTSERSATGGTITALASSPQITVYARNGSGTLTTPTMSVAHNSGGNTITFTYTAATGGLHNGTLKLIVPTGWSLPSTNTMAAGYVTSSNGTPAVSGQTVTISGVTLLAGHSVTITYGSKASGGPGATAPSTAVGAQIWQGQEKSTSLGSVVNLASSPSITVT